MSLSRRLPRALRPGLTLLALTTAGTALAPATPAFAAPARADLVIDVMAIPAKIPTTGNVVQVDMDLKNSGDAAADAPSVTITLPTGGWVAGEGPATDSEWRCDLSSLPSFACTRTALAAGQSAARLALPIHLPAGNDGESVAVTAAAVTSSPETATGNNSGKVVITYDAKIPDLYVANTTTRPDYYVVAGDWVRFGIDVGNAGSGVADGVTVRVTASPNLREVGVNDWSDPSWQCTALSSPGELNCVHQPLAAGATTGPLQFTARVNDGTPGDLIPYTFTLATTTRGDNTANNTFAGAFEYSTAVLRGQMWEDVDHDGQRGPADPALAANAGVRLVPVYGGLSRDVPLNADGSFTLVAPPDEYYLEVTLHDTTYTFTTPNVGDDTTDSDIITVSTAVGQSSQFGLSNGYETVVDIGLVKATA